MGVVAVGVDGSDRSVPALEWAANEAAAHGHTLRVVTAWSIPVTALSPGGLPAPYPIGELESDARAAQDAVIAKANVPAEIEVYADAAHGWCPPDSRAYSEPKAEHAWSRLLALYGKALA